MKEHLLLNDVAKLLGVKGYQIAYALTNGLVQEPELKISNKTQPIPAPLVRSAGFSEA